MLLHHAVPILELCEVKALEAIFAMWHSQEQTYGLKYHTAAITYNLVLRVMRSTKQPIQQFIGRLTTCVKYW